MVEHAASPAADSSSDGAPGRVPPGRVALAEPAAPAELPEFDLAYRDVFWRSRDYEDLCDRIAIRGLLPPVGGRLVEVGAGFGRLVDEYAGYREVTFFDSSQTLLEAGRERLAADPRLSFVLGDARALPFADGSFDSVVCVRVAHYFPDLAPVLGEFARILRPGGTLVLEFANKRHLKSMLKFALRRQRWSPFSPEPYEYRPLHFDHNPAQVRRLLGEAGLAVGPVRAASLFRIGLLKRHVPARVLAGIERWLQAPLGLLAVGPSVFLRARRGQR